MLEEAADTVRRGVPIIFNVTVAGFEDLESVDFRSAGSDFAGLVSARLSLPSVIGFGEGTVIAGWIACGARGNGRGAFVSATRLGFRRGGLILLGAGSLADGFTLVLAKIGSTVAFLAVGSIVAFEAIGWGVSIVSAGPTVIFSAAVPPVMGLASAVFSDVRPLGGSSTESIQISSLAG